MSSLSIFALCLITCIPVCLDTYFICYIFMLMFCDFFSKFGNREPSLFAYNFTCMFDYLKVACSVFAILSGWYQQNECLITLKHVRLVTCLLSCFLYIFKYKFFETYKLTSNSFTCMFVCLHVWYKNFTYFYFFYSS